MKLRSLCVSIAGLVFGLGSVAYGANYFPPEHIQCKLVNGSQLSCNDFNRDYLKEHTYTANLKETDKLFSFHSAVAYFTNQNEWSILMTYKDTEAKNVTLRTIRTSITPDLKNGAWKRYRDEFYTCDAGYMSCVIQY